jgi:hypothetical protein
LSSRRKRAHIRELFAQTSAGVCGVPLDPMVEGVQQGTFEELEASLRRLLEEYKLGDAARRMAVRRLVILAKDHARLAARNPEKRADKEEMILWLLTWLENPPVFAEWVRIRRGIRALRKAGQ